MYSSSEEEEVSSDVCFLYGSNDEESLSVTEDDEEEEELVEQGEEWGCDSAAAIRSSNEEWETVESFDATEDIERSVGVTAWRSFQGLAQNLSEGHGDAYSILKERNSIVYDTGYSLAQNMTPLMTAARQGDSRTVADLLHGMTMTEVGHQDLTKKTALHHAIEAGHNDIALDIMDRMDDTDLYLTERAFSNTVLHSAVFYCLEERSFDLTVTQALVERMDPVEITRLNLHRQSPFLECLAHRREDIARILLPLVTDEGLFETNSSRANALHVAFRAPGLSPGFIVELVERCPRSLQTALDAGSHTPKEFAIKYWTKPGYPKIVDLFQKSAPKGAQD